MHQVTTLEIAGSNPVGGSNIMEEKIIHNDVFLGEIELTLVDSKFSIYVVNAGIGLYQYISNSGDKIFYYKRVYANNEEDELERLANDFIQLIKKHC